MMKRTWFLRVWTLASMLGLVTACVDGGDTPLTTELVATGLDEPLYVTHAPRDFDRVFIVEQGGRIRILKSGVLLPTAFLNLASLSLQGFERGLLGLVFDPQYADNGFFYVNYTDNDGNTVVARYAVSSDPDIADGSSEFKILTIDQPFENHNGGWMDFGPDGYLYISSGDGGFREDPEDNGQNRNVLLGKILRIDVRGDDFPNQPDRNYAVPPTNPFVGIDGADEIWALGLRNPWRCAFDTVTGDLFIADVGQRLWEEINFQPASSAGGENYGWRCMEASSCTNFVGCACQPEQFVLPIHEYAHGGVPFQCSITGGEVYRGCAIPSLHGTYFFADFCSDRIWSLRRIDDEYVVSDRTNELAPGDGLSIESISSFGRDAAGEIYICDHQDGEVFKIVPVSPNGLEGIVGSVPPDGAIDARQPSEPDGTSGDAWRSLLVQFGGCTDEIVPDDFMVTRLGGEGPIPTVANVDRTGGDRVRVVLSDGIAEGARTTLTHTPSNTSVTISSLPADADGDGQSDSADVVALIGALRGDGPPQPIWSTDIDRSGAPAPPDIARLIDLLNGGGVYTPYRGVSLP